MMFTYFASAKNIHIVERIVGDYFRYITKRSIKEPYSNEMFRVTGSCWSRETRKNYQRVLDEINAAVFD